MHGFATGTIWCCTAPTGRNTTYRQIAALFTDMIAWRLIETHWQDLLQVVLSIKAGKSPR